MLKFHTCLSFEYGVILTLIFGFIPSDEIYLMHCIHFVSLGTMVREKHVKVQFVDKPSTTTYLINKCTHSEATSSKQDKGNQVVETSARPLKRGR